MSYMKKIIYIALILVLTIPSVAHAAWWKPSTWNVMRKPVESTKQATKTATTTNAVIAPVAATTTESVIQKYTEPSSAELLKRIAELEDKLDKARAGVKKETVAVEDTSKVVSSAQKTPVVTANLSDKDVAAKINTALVTIETATSTWNGAVIDAQGHIVLPFQAVVLKDTAGNTLGITRQVSVTLSNGSKKNATAVGFNEPVGVAIFQFTNKTATSYLKVNHDTSIKVGDKVYIFGTKSARNDGGAALLAGGTVSQKTGAIVEMTSDPKPFEGGMMVTAQGSFIGISNTPVCKVLEEMKTCLSYKTTATITRESFPRLLQGLKLYTDKKNSTKEESAIRGQLERIYLNTKGDSSFEYTINSVTGKNSFDYFNGKFAEDREGKITKLYLNKLKAAAENMIRAFDTFKGQANTLNIFFIEQEAALLTLDDYQAAIIKKIQITNVAKLKEYQDKVNFWSKKKNEYDGFLTNPAGASQDYLMEQGVFIEDAAAYLKAEQKKVIDTYSGEILQIF